MYGCTIDSRFPSSDTVCLHWKYCNKNNLSRTVSPTEKDKRILLCFVFCILHSINGLFWDLPKRWDRTAQKKSRLLLPWNKSSYITHNSGLSLHRSNFATFGLPRMIPDERGTIFGHEIRTTLWERTDRLTFVYYTHVGTDLLIKI
jgi:hypothetical protein